MRVSLEIENRGMGKPSLDVEHTRIRMEVSLFTFLLCTTTFR